MLSSDINCQVALADLEWGRAGSGPPLGDGYIGLFG